MRYCIPWTNSTFFIIVILCLNSPIKCHFNPVDFLINFVYCKKILTITEDSGYYNTDGIRKMYQYNQTIDITSLNFYCLGMVGIQIWYRNKQYFVITDIVITRVYCILKSNMSLEKFIFRPVTKCPDCEQYMVNVPRHLRKLHDWSHGDAKNYKKIVGHWEKTI